MYRESNYFLVLFFRDWNTPVQVIRRREIKWLDMLDDWDKWMSKKPKKVRVQSVFNLTDTAKLMFKPRNKPKALLLLMVSFAKFQYKLTLSSSKCPLSNEYCWVPSKANSRPVSQHCYAGLHFKGAPSRSSALLNVFQGEQKYKCSLQI